ncbi:PQQ-dependent sugar dehydrogenase [Candidatus Bathyarchaeota archaeon]|nr:MAG: PQQ-dependent sugar dehydrogenase [Candidatus Bathyarchaeota archaeon]
MRFGTSVEGCHTVLRFPSLKLTAKIVTLIILSTGSWIFSHAQSSTASPVTTILTGLSFPLSLNFAPDGRIFFNEKNTGNVRVIQQNGSLLSTPFATISPIFTDGESGLLGIALDPSFTTNGYLYFYHTYRDSQSYTHGHIVRYTAAGNIGTSPTNIFDVVSGAPNTPPYHNGGYIKFGPDGKLYAQVGEFHEGSPAQDPPSTTGKMLRMNSDGSVPSDNPFPGSLVYALGIRNAFGFDFDASNDRLIATEAGPSSDDEINIIVKGGNYGWPTCLGVCHNPSFIDPIVNFNPVVTPTGIATVAPNVYYFGEWNTGNTGNLERLELSMNGSVVSMSQVYMQSGGIIGVEKGPNGKLYFTSPNGIYTYDIQSPVSPMPNSLSIILAITVSIIATAVLGYLAIRYRGRHSAQPVARTQQDP